MRSDHQGNCHLQIALIKFLLSSSQDTDVSSHDGHYTNEEFMGVIHKWCIVLEIALKRECILIVKDIKNGKKHSSCALEHTNGIDQESHELP